MILNIIAIVVSLIVAFYFFQKQKRKEDKYFGKAVKLTPKETKTIEFYKRNYRPILMDSRFLTIKNNGIELDDIAKNATEMIYDYPIPTNEEISKLKSGDLVKLVFRDEDGYAERMWVEVKRIEDNIFYGNLNNDAFEFKNLKCESEIYFHSNNILEIENKQEPT